MDPWFESHFVHAARIVCGFLAECAPLATARILDFGCGDGITAAGVAALGPGQVVGADIHPSFLHLPHLAAANTGSPGPAGESGLCPGGGGLPPAFCRRLL